MSNEDEAALDDEESTADAAGTSGEEGASPAADEDASDDDGAAEAESTDASPDDAEEGDGLQADDFVELHYTARTVDEGTLVDTTRSDVAEEEGLDVEEHDFGPRIIVLGAGHLFQRVEDDIIGKSVGDTGSVQIPAPEAFGEYDPGDVRTVSVEKIPEDDRYPGAHVDLEGEHGHVETVIGGRARVDFNHPLAGEDIEYEYEIVDVVEDQLERARGYLQMFFDVDLEMWLQTDEVEEEVPVEPAADEDGEEESEADEEVEAGDEEEEEDEPETTLETVEYETLYIESNPMLSFNQEWLFQKQRIASELIDRLDIDRVIVQEIIEGDGGMFGGMGGLGGLDDLDLEESAEDLDVDVDADELVEELEAGDEPADLVDEE